jgi:hypothetical protein
MSSVFGGGEDKKKRDDEERAAREAEERRKTQLSERNRRGAGAQTLLAGRGGLTGDASSLGSSTLLGG